MTDFEQYLRDNLMPTKQIDKKYYRTIEKKCVYKRIDGDVE